MLRSPNATLTRSKEALEKGSASASQSTVGRTIPSSIRRSRPWRSIASLMSVWTTVPVSPAGPAKARARSPVPPAMSSTLSPGRTLATATAYAFQARCRPSDMRSFIRSYFGATESNTPRTRSALADVSTLAKPKWVSLIAPSRPSVRMAARGVVHVRIRCAHRRVACDALFRQAFLVLRPELGLPGAEVVEVIPRKDAAFVTVGKDRLHGIVADRLQRLQPDLALARLQHLLARAVALHFGGRRVDAHQLERNAKALAIVETDLEHARALVHGDDGRLRSLRSEAGHGGRSDEEKEEERRESIEPARATGRLGDCCGARATTFSRRDPDRLRHRADRMPSPTAQRRAIRSDARHPRHADGHGSRRRAVGPGHGPGPTAVRQVAAALDEHALDAALVGERHVLRHPVVAEDAVGHLDDDVVGFEQAGRQVALVALQALQAARARGQDLQVCLGRALLRACRQHGSERRLVLAQLFGLAKANLGRDVGPRDAEGAALAAATVALSHVLADQRLDREERLAQLHRAVTRIVEQVARTGGIGPARAAQRDPLLEQVLVDVDDPAVREDLLELVALQLVVAGAAAHDDGLDVEVVECVGDAVKQHADVGDDLLCLAEIARAALRIAAAQIPGRQHRLHAGVPEHRLGCQADLREQPLRAAARKIEDRLGLGVGRLRIADDRNVVLVLDVEQRARCLVRQAARHLLVDEVDHLLLERCLADGRRGLVDLLVGEASEQVVGHALRLEADIDFGDV